MQLTRTFDKLKDARAELSRIRHETDQGTYVKPSKLTVNQYLDEYLRSYAVERPRPRARAAVVTSMTAGSASSSARVMPSRSGLAVSRVMATTRPGSSPWVHASRLSHRSRSCTLRADTREGRDETTA